ncbi:hypothetical protein GWK47_001868 [Chionoecetes opilio]|uniref:Uncharacterized protein n=1 Tax=Chionoecetes opilio TaxID=41210 RepID=A0A8J5CJL2_CHIOP|nr:hypothetical protein GWK47_001868 [Chionoecetes opilio]
MTSTRRRPEDPDDAGFILQRKRFRVTKPSSQQSGATAAEQPIPVWRVVRHDDFPSPYQLVRGWSASFGSPSGGCLRLRGFSFSGGRLRTPPPPSRKWLMANPRGIVLARREPSRRGVLVGYPTGPPPGPCIGAPARRVGGAVLVQRGP